MRIILTAIILSVILASCMTSGKTKDQGKKNMNDQPSLEYKIDNKIVTKEEFDIFLKTLKELPHTWFCAETTKGGFTGYDAVDAQGVIYEYRAYSESGSNRSFITKKLTLGR